MGFVFSFHSQETKLLSSCCSTNTTTKNKQLIGRWGILPALPCRGPCPRPEGREGRLQTSRLCRLQSKVIHYYYYYYYYIYIYIHTHISLYIYVVLYYVCMLYIYHRSLFFFNNWTNIFLKTNGYPF